MAKKSTVAKGNTGRSRAQVADLYPPTAHARGQPSVRDSHPHGVSCRPSAVGESCAHRFVEWDFPPRTEREEFVRVDEHRNYDGSLTFCCFPFALGISFPLIEREREGILRVLHDFLDKRVVFASVPRCKVHSRFSIKKARSLRALKTGLN